ncbi:hypothetical protein D3C81_1916500 [compost metagenome]
MVGRARQQRKRTLETSRMRRQFSLQTEVPFAAHQCLITGLAQQLRQRHHPIVEIALITRFTDQFRRQRFGHGADPCDVVVGAGQQHRTRWRTGRRSMKIGQAQAIVGQGIKVRRGDFAAERTDVGEA